jgi:hypothetical protein
VAIVYLLTKAHCEAARRYEAAKIRDGASSVPPTAAG